MTLLTKAGREQGPSRRAVGEVEEEGGGEGTGTSASSRPPCIAAMADEHSSIGAMLVTAPLGLTASLSELAPL